MGREGRSQLHLRAAVINYLTTKCFVMMVPPVSIRTAIEAVLQAVLTLSVVVVYGVGSVAAVEYEHDHGDFHPAESTEAPHEHHHHDHDGHDHNDGEDERDGEAPDDEGNQSSHHHSHVLSFDTQVETNFVKLLVSAIGVFSNERVVFEGDLCPDGPFYELSKPPQLG